MSPRTWPRALIVKRLKIIGIRQATIARQTQLSQGYVCKVIARVVSPTAATERVWKALEEALR